MLLLIALAAVSVAANAQDKPNILVIWGDDVGQSNTVFLVDHHDFAVRDQGAVDQYIERLTGEPVEFHH